MDLRVGVEHVQRRALAVDDAVLVLAETEQGLVGRRVEGRLLTVLVLTPSTVDALRLLAFSDSNTLSLRSV